ncbi:MAG: hypothetical protein IT261_01690 [Saprospiraceae bacterium]|nr:hypothetical protein [Saprospiraceae bacterium]
MKSWMTLAFTGLFLANLAAQSEQTLFQKAKIRGGFGGPIFSYGQVKGNHGFGAGGGGGLVINQAMIGAFGQGEMFTIPKADGIDGAIALGYGGLWLGYSVPTQKAIHGFASMKVGVGGVGVTNRYDWWDEDDLDFNDYDRAVLVLMPEVGVELNLFHWMRLAGTVGYRFVDGFEGGLGLGKKDLNAPVFGLTMRFGWFGHKEG